MSENKPPLLLSNYFVEKLHFEALPKFDPNLPDAGAMSVDPDVFNVPNQPHDYMVRLGVSLSAPAGSNTRCRLNFSLIGFFRVDEAVPDKLRNEMVYGNAPLILFGIARQLAAEITANGPYGKVILGTVNFTEIFRRKAAEAAPKAAGSDEFKVSDKPVATTRRPRVKA